MEIDFLIFLKCLGNAISLSFSKFIRAYIKTEIEFFPQCKFEINLRNCAIFYSFFFVLSINIDNEYGKYQNHAQFSLSMKSQTDDVHNSVMKAESCLECMLGCT